jgi:hypothetical protein
VCGFQRLGAYYNFRHVVLKGLDGNILTELGKASESILMLQSMTLYRLTYNEDVQHIV